MPHIKLECSANTTLDFQAFFQQLSDRLVATGHAKRMGIKCQVAPVDDYFIIDGNPEYKMVNLLFRLREGRSEETLAHFSTIGIELLEQFLEKDIKEKKIIISTEFKILIKGRDLTKNSTR